MLARVIYILDDDVLADACWAISCLPNGCKDKIQAVIAAGIPSRLVELMVHTSTSVQTSALRAVGNMCTGDDIQTQVMIDCGSLPALLSLLGSANDLVRTEVCWAISNITAGNCSLIQAVLGANLVTPLLSLLSRGNLETRKEACWAICNATSASVQNPDQTRYLVSQGCIPPLCDLLVCPDNRIIQIVLEGLHNILKVGEIDKGKNGQGELPVNSYTLFIEDAGGMEKIHDCQNNADDKIYRTAYSLIDQYFSEDDAQNEELSAPQPRADGFNSSTAADRSDTSSL